MLTRPISYVGSYPRASAPDVATLSTVQEVGDCAQSDVLTLSPHTDVAVSYPTFGLSRTSHTALWANDFYHFGTALWVKDFCQIGTTIWDNAFDHFLTASGPAPVDTLSATLVSGSARSLSKAHVFPRSLRLFLSKLQGVRGRTEFGTR